MLTLLAAIAVAGCGSGPPDREDRAETSRRAKQVVTKDQLERTRAGSPQRTVLLWWRNLQFRNPSGALELLTEAARAEVERGFATALYRDVAPWIEYARPHFLDVRHEGSRATVFLEVRVNQVIGPETVGTTEEPVALPLVRRGREWRISDAGYFRRNAERLRAARLDRDAGGVP